MGWLRRLLKSPWLPWAILGALILLGTTYLVFRPASFQDMSRSNQLFLGGAVLAEVLLVFLFINRVMDLYEQRSQLQLKLVDRDRQVSQAYQRLEALFQVVQKFVEATDENYVIEVVLRLSVDLAAAKGASFVPLDDHSQPMAATTHGDLPPSVGDPWLEYLASPAVRDRCQACEHHEHLNSACPLLKGPIGEASGIYCLPIRRAEREFGVLNLFLQPAAEMDRDARSFLSVLGDVTALALEGVRLRRREIATLRQIQSIRQKSDQQALLTNLLDSVFQSLDSDAAVMILKSPPANPEFPKIVLGDVPASLQPFMDGVIQGMIESGKPVILGDVAGDSSNKNSLRSFIGVPMLLADRSPGGAILMGSRRAHGYNQRQLNMLQTVAGQLTLVLQNSRQATELEYQAVMEERKRLAREIHDGLAQALGFLKLQAAQTRNYLARQEYDRARQAIDQYYATLNEAYRDARQAIDGLRVGLDQEGIQGWLEETAQEFQEMVDLPVIIRRMESNTPIAPEIHAQLIRIVQEALSNIRKHAQAGQITLDCFEADGDLWIEVNDDGVGFSPDELTGPSRHGLRGMRERADLIGADFQVISQVGQGTTVRVRLPLRKNGIQELAQ